MLPPRSKWLALVGGALLATSSVFAQDGKAILDMLVKKGLLTTDEASQITAEAKKSASTNTTTVSAKLYADVTTIDAKTDSGAKVASSGLGVDVKRFYFGVTHQFDKVWSANINTDAGYSSATGATNLFIKTAYVQAKFSPEAIVQLGSANMPWIPFDEDIYGLRYVENTLIDRLHFGNSADWGVHFLGSHGMVNYNFAAVNGGGYKNPTRGKGLDLEGRVAVEPVKGLTLAAGFYDGRLGKNTYAAPSNREATRYNALISYSVSKLLVGAEYFYESDWGQTASPLSDDGDGFALFGTYKLNTPLSLFARYDDSKTSKKLHPNMEEQYFNLGLQYHVMKGLDISLVYKHDDIDHPASASTVTKYDEFGLFSQVAF